MIPTLALAYEKFDFEETYFDAVQSAGEYTYRNILQHEGVGVCRGTTHNIYMLAILFKLTKEERYRYYIYEVLKIIYSFENY